MTLPDKDWEYATALLPFQISFQTVPMGTGYDGDDQQAKVQYGKLIHMEVASNDQQRLFYEALLKLPWLSPTIRAVVTKELGLSLRAENVNVEKARTITMKHVFDEVKARMRESGEKPRGGIHEKAVEVVADMMGMKSEALIQRFKRIKRRKKNR